MIGAMTITEGIRISVEVRPLPERTSAAAGQYAYAYTIRIENVGVEPAQLIDRHWVITDAAGNVEEVRGPGVVGRQPRLEPGQTFEYTSWVALRTAFGSMRGEYSMVRPDGSGFEARIAEFALAPPHGMN
jgi:ApaG protein